MANGFVVDDTFAFRGRASRICTFCANYIDDYKCRAFSTIPEEIWMGDNDHRKPYPGDNGIQFEPKASGKNGV